MTTVTALECEYVVPVECYLVVILRQEIFGILQVYSLNSLIRTELLSKKYSIRSNLQEVALLDITSVYVLSGKTNVNFLLKFSCIRPKSNHFKHSL